MCEEVVLIIRIGDCDISPVMFRSRVCSGSNKVHTNLAHGTTLCMNSITGIVSRKKREYQASLHEPENVR